VIVPYLFIQGNDQIFECLFIHGSFLSPCVIMLA
jgi:hypothetical protein